MSSTLPPELLNWLYSVLQVEYVDPVQTYRQSAQLLAFCATLRPRTKVFTAENGIPQLLLNVFGTVPANIGNQVYHIPVDMWFPLQFPVEPPFVYVSPTPEMSIKPGNFVDSNGRFYNPYLTYWRDSSTLQGSNVPNLIELTRVMCECFGKEPPVYAKSTAAPERTYTPEASEDIPPLPAKPFAKGPPPLPQKPRHQNNDSVVGQAATSGSQFVPPDSQLANVSHRYQNNDTHFQEHGPHGMAPPKPPLPSSLRNHKPPPPTPDDDPLYKSPKKAATPVDPDFFDTDTSSPAPYDVERCELLADIERQIKYLVNEQPVSAQFAFIEEGNQRLQHIRRDVHNIERNLIEFESRLSEATVELTAKIKEYGDTQAPEVLREVADPDIDTLLCAETVIFQQLYDVVAASEALEDTIGVVQQLYTTKRSGSDKDGIVGFESMVKNVRSLSREQFRQKALVNRIVNITGLNQ